MGEGRSQIWLIVAVMMAFVVGVPLFEQYFGDKPPPTAQEGGGAGARGKAPSKRPPADPAVERAVAARMAERARAERRVTIENESFRAEVSSLNTGLRSLVLKNERFADPETGRLQDLVSTDKEAYLPFVLELVGAPIPEDAVWSVEQLSPTAARFQWEGHGLRVTRKLEAGRGHELWSTVRIENQSGAPRAITPRARLAHYVAVEAEEGSSFFGARSPWQSGGLCHFDGEVGRYLREDARKGQNRGPRVRFAGVENRYFAMLAVVDGADATACWVRGSDRGGTRAEPVGTLYEARLVLPRVEVPAGGATTIRTLGYFGPKHADALHAAGHGIPDVIDRGPPPASWFPMVADFLVILLAWIYGFVGNWGVAIICLTALVKVVLFPLSLRQIESMAKMREIRPELDEISKKFADDQQAKGAATMELFRKRGVSPTAGCLPALAQLPIWFAFYASLSSNVELFHASFALWWTDLSAPDPYFVLPLVLGVLMFVQQKITPTTMDPVQAKMMLYMMPVMMTTFMLFLPAGLCLYSITNSVLGIGQQQWIMRLIDRRVANMKSTRGEAGSQGTAEPVAVAAGNIPKADAGSAGKGAAGPNESKRRTRGR